LYIAKKDYKNALAKIALLPESFIRFQQEAYVRSLRKDYQGAYRAIEKAWLQIKKHKIKLRDNMFLYFSIDIAEKSKNIQKVIEWLEPEIRKNPSDTNLKNTLGYILADHNVELQKAYRLLKDVVTAEPENGAYLDSMAWVLYRLKRYEEAKKYILLALKYHSDRVVLDHAGDIFHALKDDKMAAEYWRRALRSKGETDAKVIQEKLRKLQSGRKAQ
jgi:tetratricopeptide (TPR) repeat protein